ncbi:MAG: efflux transporter outer membrane subunit [Burkholderiaceae bacterium]|jgi:NodT family efflux transporter outer membrane factor (OMF) lipoprotein
MNTFRFLAALSAVALTLGGCSLAPLYRTPDAAMPAQFKEAPPGWTMARPTDEQGRGAWWQAVSDPELDRLLVRLDDANQNLKVAEARWRQASALGRQYRAALLPTVTAQLGAARSGGAVSATAGSSSAINRSFTGSLNAAWDTDLWGRLRNQSAAQDAAIAASAADVANARLSLQGELVANYLALRVADAQRQLLDDIATAYAGSLQIVRNRYAVGVASRADVAQAESQWFNARAQAEDTAVNRAQLEHAIAVLIGEAPTMFGLAPWPPEGSIKLTSSAALTVPAALPSTLLQRRPDIAAAERRLAAANAATGTARAALFPALTLSAGETARGRNLAELFSLSNTAWSLGTALATTVFDFGARRAGVEQATANYDASLATYRQTVLDALLSVEDQLAALRILDQEIALQTEATRAAGEAVAFTNNQYKAGTVPFLNVLTAQAADQAARRTLLTLNGRRLTATVLLIQALGGGWEGLEAATP